MHYAHQHVSVKISKSKKQHNFIGAMWLTIVCIYYLCKSFVDYSMEVHGNGDLNP